MVPGDISASPWTRGLVVNRGQQHWSSAHLFSPTANSTLLMPCQATPQPAGGNLQLQHLSRINSSAPALKANRCMRETRRGLTGTCGQGLAHVKGNNVLLIYCSVGFCSLYVEIGHFVVNNGATYCQMSEWDKNNGAYWFFMTAFQEWRMCIIHCWNCWCFNFPLKS